MRKRQEPGEQERERCRKAEKITLSRRKVVGMGCRSGQHGLMGPGLTTAPTYSCWGNWQFRCVFVSPSPSLTLYFQRLSCQPPKTSMSYNFYSMRLHKYTASHVHTLHGYTYRPCGALLGTTLRRHSSTPGETEEIPTVLPGKNDMVFP